jgi:hypothetical protein
MKRWEIPGKIGKESLKHGLKSGNHMENPFENPRKYIEELLTRSHIKAG